MKIKDYFAVLGRRWVWLAVSLLIGITGAVALTFTATPQYTASAQLFVTSGEVTTSTELAQGSTFAQNRVKSYSTIISSDLVLTPVSDQFGIPGPELTPKIKTTIPLDTALINIVVTDTDPARAAGIANYIADNFPAVAQKIEPPREDGKPTVNVVVTGHADVPTAPSSPSLILNTALGALIGLLVGIILMALVEALSSTPKSQGSGRITGLANPNHKIEIK